MPSSPDANPARQPVAATAASPGAQSRRWPLLLLLLLLLLPFTRGRAGLVLLVEPWGMVEASPGVLLLLLLLLVVVLTGVLVLLWEKMAAFNGTSGATRYNQYPRVMRSVCTAEAATVCSCSLGQPIGAGLQLAGYQQQTTQHSHRE
jgi:hypothetical protein